MRLFVHPRGRVSVFTLLLCAASFNGTFALKTLSVAWLRYNGEHDRCRWVCPVGTFCLAPTWQCSRGSGLLEFSDDDKNFLRKAFGVILGTFSDSDLASQHYDCVAEVTTDWPIVEAAPGSVPCGDYWYEDYAGFECELQAKYDLTALSLSYTWAPLQLIPQMEVLDESDYDADATSLQRFSSAVAWAYLARTMGWYYTRDTWYTQYWANPTLKINLAALRSGKYSLRYWGGTLIHELLHQMGHPHPDGQGPNFVYGVDECLEFEGDADAVQDFRVTGIR